MISDANNSITATETCVDAAQTANNDEEIINLAAQEILRRFLPAFEELAR